MVRTTFPRVRFVLIALLALAATGGVAAHRSTVSNVILVHGAWADGSSWSRVIPLLEASGLNVTAVQLPLTSLTDDVNTTNRAIALMEREHPGPIVLVGHSYAGVVIGEAGNDPNVTGLVYVASVAPDQGQSLLSLLNGWQTPSPIGNHLVLSGRLRPRQHAATQYRKHDSQNSHRLPPPKKRPEASPLRAFTNRPWV